MTGCTPFCPEVLFSWKGGIRLIDEDVSRRTIAVSIKATKLTGRVLAQACLAVGRKIRKTYRARQTPHGKQTVRQLMGHGAATNSIEVESPKDFDRVARKWNVDYAFYKTGPDKYLLFFKAGQADAMTACFSEYSRKVLNKSKSRRIPIRDQLKRASEQLAQERPRPKEYGAPTKSQDFEGRGGAKERADFGGRAAEGAERTLHRRQEVAHADR